MWCASRSWKAVALRDRERSDATSLVVEHEGGPAFRFPFPQGSGWTGMGIGNGPVVAESKDGAGGDEPDEGLTEALVAHAGQGA